jgi:archaeal cell division control protein 6
LRVAAEIAGRRGEKISKKHVDAALEKLQKDRVRIMLSSAPYHLKLAAAAIARISYLTEETWHSTSTLYNQYRHITAKETSPLTYRRISELLTELENMGLVISHTSSKGRQGYGTQYKLVVPPEVIGKVCSASEDWWNNIVERKKKHDRDLESQSIFTTRESKNSPAHFTNQFDNLFNSIKDEDWKKFVVGSE